MRIEESKYSIAELVDWMKSRDLIVNAEYQRGGGLWPNAAKSYFIDTILRSFPFPKVYLHEKLEKATRRPKREIVDGQQRLTTLLEFVDGRFALGKNARDHEGMSFAELSEGEQETFLSYTVSADVIRNAERGEILQMFRRMNAFTLPLNEAEKRHSEFFGEFKDWINRLLDAYGNVLNDWKILTSRQVVRMADAEFIADLALAIQDGIVSTSPAKLRALYNENDSQFPNLEALDTRIRGAFDFVTDTLSPIQGTFLTKTHMFHSLLCALMHNYFGLPGAAEELGLECFGEFVLDRDEALTSLLRLASAYEENDDGRFHEFVQAASEGGNRKAQRVIRVQWLSRALRGEFA